MDMQKWSSGNLFILNFTFNYWKYCTFCIL